MDFKGSARPPTFGVFLAEPSDARVILSCMTFVRTNVHDKAEGYLACDWPGCSATSPTFRMHLGPLPVNGWHVVPRRGRWRVEYFCDHHVAAARARAKRP